jgi:hypothetical protein
MTDCMLNYETNMVGSGYRWEILIIFQLQIAGYVLGFIMISHKIENKKTEKANLRRSERSRLNTIILPIIWDLVDIEIDGHLCVGLFLFPSSQCSICLWRPMSSS